MIAVAAHNFIQLWNLQKSDEPRTLGGHRDYITALLFSPDSQQLFSAGQDGVIRRWDIAAGKATSRMSVPGGGVTTLALSPKAQLVISGGADKNVRLWDIKTGKERWTASGHVTEPRFILFTDAGKTVVSADKDTVIWWRADNGKEVRRYADVVPFDIEAVSPEAKIIVASHGGNHVRLLDPATGQLMQSLPGHRFSRSTVFSPDGRVLAAAEFMRPRGDGVSWYETRGAIALWDVSSAKERHFPWENQQPIRNAVFLASGDLLVSVGNDVQVREKHSMRLLCAFQQEPGVITDLAVSPDEKLTAVRVRDTPRDTARIAVWGLTLSDLTQCKRKALWDDMGFDLSLSFDAGSRFVMSANSQGNLRFWSALPGAGKRDVTLKEFDSEVPLLGSQSFSRGGRLFASSFLKKHHGALLGQPPSPHGPVRVWNTNTGEVLSRLASKDDRIHGMAFSPDDCLLALAATDYHGNGRRSVRLYDLKTRKERRWEEWDEGAALAFSPDTRMLASGSRENNIRLWEVATGFERGSFAGHEKAISSLSFSQDGRYLFSTSEDKTAFLWDMSRLPVDPVLRVPTANSSLWNDLARLEGTLSYMALKKLVTEPNETISLIKKELHPLTDVGSIDTLIAKLDSNQVVERDQAMKDLEWLGDLAEPDLRKALDKKPGRDKKRRLLEVIERLDIAKSPRRLRGVRALEILETLATPPAMDVLKELSGGTPEAWLTRDAKASLERLKRHKN
jgi:WD40 repeat protein